MDVLYTCDNNYVWLMGISMTSLFENNKHIKNLNVFLLGEKVTLENKKILSQIGEKYDRMVSILDVPQLDIPDAMVSERWPLSAFTRLYSSQILPVTMKRILYLDCDTIVSGDIEKLNYFDMRENVVCGVKDCIGSSYKKNIGLEKNDIYINAGVLLINLEALRALDIKSEIDCYMRKYIKFINYADQDILNGIFKGKIGVIGPQYDVMTISVVHSYEEIQLLRRPTRFYTKNELEIASKKPVIIHYTTNMRVVRPWFSNSNHPFVNEFRKYMSMSQWTNRKLVEMKFTTGESKIIGVISKLPKKISYRVLGIIHSELKPRYIRIKAKRRKD